MLLTVLDRSVLFLGGKGGVGKTSLASALALARADQGARVLVVSTDPAHNLGHLWKTAVGDAPVRLCDTDAGGRVDGVEIDPAATIERHLRAVEQTMIRMLPERQHAQARAHLERARLAPGSHESAVLERIAEAAELGRREYDLVVFDTAPSGHTLRLLALPGQLAGWTDALLGNRARAERFSAAMRGVIGRNAPEATPDAELLRTLHRRRQRFDALREAITDPRRCGFVVVCTAEALPVAETVDVVEALSVIGVPVAGLIVNRRSPVDAGEVLRARRVLEDNHLAALRRRLSDLPVTEIPLMPGELTGVVALRRLAAEFESLVVDQDPR